MIVESAKPTVLIVDDMPENIDILRGILKDDKTTVYWWYSLLESIVKHKRKQLTDVLERTYFFLKENAGRAHPKRDKSTGLYQFGVEPNSGVTS